MPFNNGYSLDATLTTGSAGFDMDAFDLSSLGRATIVARSANLMQFDLGDGIVFSVTGSGFTYDGSGWMSGGEIIQASGTVHGQTAFTVTGLDIPGDVFGASVDPSQVIGFGWPALFSANDTFVGADEVGDKIRFSAFDSISGGSGPDTFSGSYSGRDSIEGNGGNDLIQMGQQYSNLVHGGTGDDTIVLGGGSDIVNGNQGNDSISDLSGGYETLLGGQGDDTIRIAGHGLANGNLGDDTITASGAWCTLRGGQGDDLITGCGNLDSGSWISGDLGHNTLVGSQGSDTFHAGAGYDLVEGFSKDIAAGNSSPSRDFVQIDAGITYTVSQVGADVHIGLSTGGQIVLQNVQLSSLGPTSGWLIAG